MLFPILLHCNSTSGYFFLKYNLNTTLWHLEDCAPLHWVTMKWEILGSGKNIPQP